MMKCDPADNQTKDENRVDSRSALERGEARAVKAFELARALPISERFGVTASMAAQYIGISKTRVYELLHDGTLEGRIIRGRRVVLVSSLLKLMGSAPSTKRVRAA